jgi:cytochrome c-type biogenesis protein CcmH
LTTFVLAAVVFIAVAITAYFLGLAANKADQDAGRALREMLLTRAAGKLSTDEFEQRQRALHDSLSGVATPSRNRVIHLVPPVLLGITVAALYAWVSPSVQEASTPKTTAAVPARPASSAMPAQPGGDLEQMTRRLAERLKREPGDGPGWALLARARSEMRQYHEAEEAFSQAAKILPPDAALLADWANARASAQAGKWDKAALDLIARALAAEPNNLKALSLAGKAAYAREDYAQAITYWQKMKAGATADSIDAKEADAGIAEARARLSGVPATAPAAVPSAGPATSTMDRIENTKRR